MATLGEVMVNIGADMSSFEDAIESVSRSMTETSNNIRRQSEAMSRALQSTAPTTEMLSRMEQWKQKMIQSNDKMIAKATQSAGVIKRLQQLDMQGLDRQFLRIGDRLENVAKKGDVLNLALQRVGEDASFVDIIKEVGEINKGLGRMTTLQMGMLTFNSLLTLGMINLSNAVDGRLIPASEKFTKVWADALTPIANAWTDWTVKIVDFGTAVGEAFGNFTKANPILSGIMGNIAYLTSLMTLMLAPLSAGIGKAGFVAAFTLMFNAIKPFVVGLLSVIGTALLTASSIVLVTHAINGMWKNSENLRNAVTGVWNDIKKAFSSAYNSINPYILILQRAFDDLATTIFGGASTIEEKFTTMGDVFAKVIEMLRPLISTVFTGIFKVAVAILVPIIKTLITVFDSLAKWWKENGSTVGSLAKQQFENIAEGVKIVTGFIQKMMPTIMKVISLAFGIIKDVVSEVVPLFMKLAKEVFPLIASVVQFVFPLVLAIIQSIWNNVKGVIISGLNIIIGVLGIFKNLFTGNWSAMWDSVKLVVSNILPFLWNLLNLFLFGKMLKGIVAFGKGLVTATKTAFTTMWTNIKTIFTNLMDDVGRILTNMRMSVTAIWNSMKTGAINTVTGMKASVSIIWNSLKGVAGKAFEAVQKAIMTPINTVKEKVLGVVQAIKDAFSGMKLSIPKPSLPKLVSTTKTIAGKSIPWFDVQWNASGNVFDGASVLGGGQGVGEAGAEVVMPIERKRYMKPYAGMVASLLDDMDSEGSGNVTNINVTMHGLTIREEADVDKIVESIDRKVRIQNRAKGLAF